jgi:hypothetical protein
MRVKVQFSDGEVRMVTERHADHLIAAKEATLFEEKEEKKEIETKEEKTKRQTKKK